MSRLEQEILVFETVFTIIHVESAKTAWYVEQNKFVTKYLLAGMSQICRYDKIVACILCAQAFNKAINIFRYDFVDYIEARNYANYFMRNFVCIAF